MPALNRLGRGAARHARLVIVIWLIATIGAVSLAAGFGGALTDRLSIPGSEAQRAADILQARFRQVAGTSVTVVFRAEAGTVRDPGAAAAIGATLAAIGRQPGVVGVTDPLAAAPEGSVSADGTIAFASIQYEKQAGELGQATVDRLDAAAGISREAGLQVELGGELLDYASPLEGSAGEGIGLLAALVVLLVAFGSAVAAALPVLTALVALAGGISLVVLMAATTDISTVAPVIAAMLGLGAGIDYALFVVSRFREQLGAGHTVVDAAGTAIATSGRVVLFAGSTVVISLLGLWLANLPLVSWLGTAAAITVGVTVLAAITVLPAILGLLGSRIDRLHVPSLARRASSGRATGSGGLGWAAWSRRVVARPWPYLLASLGLLLVLTFPVLDLRLGLPDQGSQSVATTQRRAYDLLARGFGPGVNGPILLVVELARAGDTAVLDRIVGQVAGDPDVAAVTPPQTNGANDTAVITAIPRSAPQSVETRDLVERLRMTALPVATAGTDATVAITGVTATLLDLAAGIAGRLPLVIGAVIAVSFILLLLAFRSIVIALTAAVLNLLSLGAAFGVIVAIFQWGWGVSLVGLDQAVPIVSFVPLMVFAILFGLSMDYEVFLLSRIREAYAAGADTSAAVVSGVGSTARVITSAALIMVAVFLSFVPAAQVDAKMIGIGLATAVLVDASIVRVILLPAAMAIIGGANWWIPRWLDRWLPHVGLERPTALPER